MNLENKENHREMCEIAEIIAKVWEFAWKCVKYGKFKENM